MEQIGHRRLTSGCVSPKVGSVSTSTPQVAAFFFFSFLFFCVPCGLHCCSLDQLLPLKLKEGAPNLSRNIDGVAFICTYELKFILCQFSHLYILSISAKFLWLLDWGFLKQEVGEGGGKHASRLRLQEFKETWTWVWQSILYYYLLLDITSCDRLICSPETWSWHISWQCYNVESHAIHQPLFSLERREMQKPWGVAADREHNGRGSMSKLNQDRQEKTFK